MSEKVKIAVILAVTAIVIMGMYLYFTPYQQCVRAYGDDGKIECNHTDKISTSGY